MDLMERAALLVLLQDSKHRWSEVTDQVEEDRSALEVLREVSASAQRLFNVDEAQARRLEEAAALIKEWESEGIQFRTLLEEDYPQQLLSIHQRPPFVTWRGKLDARDAQGVAVVGTRGASPVGIANASELASGLAERGVTVVSGLAKGIDTAAHLGALRAGGRTVAVIGTGLRVSYPRENAELQRRIAEEGLVLSQFLPDAPPTRTSFPMRNAIMSGYAAATVVIEAPAQSGARMQARLALQHGRRVFLMRSLLQHEWARDYATRPGTTVVDSVDDVVRDLSALTSAADDLVWA